MAASRTAQYLGADGFRRRYLTDAPLGYAFCRVAIADVGGAAPRA